MSNPAEAATQGKNPDAAENKATKFETAVNEVVKNITRGADGKYILPDDVSEEVRYAAILEQRRRDTQSEFTKAAQVKKALEAENKALKQKAIGEVKLTLTDEQKEELDTLKFEDPEAWRKKMNRYEREALDKHAKEVDDEIAQVSADTLAKDELERRKDVLTEFNQANPDFQLNDDIIANDVPPRITKKLETGKISFEQFLQEVYDYQKTGKIVKQKEETNDQPNLSKVGGGHRPDKHAEQEDIILSYNKEVF